MKAKTLGELAKVFGGELHGPAHLDVTGFATDNRIVNAGDLFLAIKGNRVDGHDYADGALALGAAGTLAERPVAGPYILVTNLVAALARLGAFYRDQFAGPVVGVTGSAGKTSAKEFIAAALQTHGTILKTEGNRNTEYTAPLLWAEMQGDEFAAVVEMSMRGLGQIAHLAAFSRPQIGLITNIGFAHIEALGSRDAIAQAKAELLDALPHDGYSILPSDDDYYAYLAGRAKGKVLTFGERTGQVVVMRYQPIDWSRSEVEFEAFGTIVTTQIPVVGRYMALNAAGAIAAAHMAGVPVKQAAEALAYAKLPPMRMQAVPFQGATLVVDAYNATPSGMKGALQSLSEMPAVGRRRAVIGQMNELGDASEECHREVGRILAGLALDEICFYGPFAEVAFAETKASGLASVRMAKSLDDVATFIMESREGDTVLIKGSRGLELEKALEKAGVKA